MSLQPSIIEPVPDETARVARAAFPKGNLYLTMRDQLGTLFTDLDFAALYPRRGQPAFAPWRLALITVMQFLENLSDRAAADAVRSRIDWKYALGLPLEDAGFDYSVLSNFRARLIDGKQPTLLFDRLLKVIREKQLLKERGRQRTDSTYVLAAIRVMNRLELVTETMRAMLNELAAVVPDWLRSVSALEWFDRYRVRAEQTRLPLSDKGRTEFAVTVGRDGFRLLELLASEQPDLLELEKVGMLKQVWERHYTRGENGEVEWRKPNEMTRAATAIESPYDADARHSTKRELTWTGYKVHLSETCDNDLPHLITNVHTTVATTQDVACTSGIQTALAEKGLLPARHLVDAGYVDAELFVESRREHNVELFGPTRLNPSWQAREGGYDSTQFEVNWEGRQAVCPMGNTSGYWYEYQTKELYSREVVKIRFKSGDCLNCANRPNCVRGKNASRSLLLPRREYYEALRTTRAKLSSEEGKREYRQRAGIEGTLSQGVRRGGLRQSRYCGLEKTHLQQSATATGINILRTINFLNQVPVAKTRTSRFAGLAQ